MFLQVKDLESRLQRETARAELAERTNVELQEEHQAACDLVRSKDQLVALGLAEVSQLKESLAQSTAQQEKQNARWEEELSEQHSEVLLVNKSNLIYCVSPSGS